MVSSCVIRKTLAQALIALLVFNPLMTRPAFPQSQVEIQIKELKENIRKLEAIDKDKNNSSGIKERNGLYLREQREQLRDLLLLQIKDLKAYKAGVGSALNQEQNRRLDSDVVVYEKDLQEVEAAIPTSSPTGSSRGASSPQLQAPPPTSLLPSQSTDLAAGTKPSTQAEAVQTPTTVPPQTANTGISAANIGVCSNTYLNDAPPKLKEVAGSAARKILKSKDSDSISDFFHELTFFTLVDALAQGEAESEARAKTILKNIQVKEETKRTDTQIGASASAAGSTSATEKPNFARLLGIAIDHGAIQQAINGTTLTLSTTPYVIQAASAKRGDTAETYQQYGDLSRIGLSASFNIQNKDNPLQSATGDQFSEGAVKFRFTRDYSIRSKEFEDHWRKHIASKISGVAVVLTGALFNTFKDDISEQSRRAALDKFIGAGGLIKAFLASHTNTSEAALQGEILCRMKEGVYDKVDDFNISPEIKRRLLDESLPRIAEAFSAEEKAYKEAEAKISEFNGRGVGTFAYTFKRQLMKQDYSVLRLLYQKKVLPSMNMIANLGSSFYHHPNKMMNQDTLRDVAVALSFEGSIGKSPFLNNEIDQSQVTLSLSGRYQRLFENRHVAKKKADLASVQLKIEVPFATGLSFPFSVTYANATDLIKEDHVRVNFGFSFDASKLALLGKFLSSKAPSNP